VVVWLVVCVVLGGCFLFVWLGGAGFEWGRVRENTIFFLHAMLMILFSSRAKL